MARKKKKKQQIGIVEQIGEFLDSEHWSAMKGKLGKFLLVIILLGGVCGGFAFLDGYVQRVGRQRGTTLTVKMVNQPSWASTELVQQVCFSTGIRCDDDLMNDTLTQNWAANLRGNPWVRQVNLIRKCYDGLVEIDCELRRPVASIRQQNKRYYLDAEGVVLEHLPLADITDAGHVVELTGAVRALPGVGQIVQADQIVAGLQVLVMIKEVDDHLPVRERLWSELALLDVSNYEGRIDRAASHLTIYTHHNTEVRWGAAINRSRPYAEASEKNKLMQLYQSHAMYNSLDQFEYVDLRDSGKTKSDPVKHSLRG